ncbi:MAG: CapA family protein [Tissierellia bacterium]|nr:CapA family protein [Tissierellia bacterium]
MKNKILYLIVICLTIVLILSGCLASITNIVDKNISSEIEDNLVKEIPIIKDEIPIEVEEIVEDKIEEISILAVGDIMFHSPQVRAAYLGESKYDFTSNFKYVKKYIEEADISLANFETVTGGNHIPYSGFPRFNSPKETLLALADTGFDIISTANNHSLDRGKDGILSTLDNIEEYGLKSIGTNRNKEDESILIQEVKGIKIAFLSYTYGLNGLDSLLTQDELSFMINLIDEEKIERDIKKAEEIGVDLVVLFLHWGNEYHRMPSDYQVELGEKILNWGGNIIFGSHPHVIQKSEGISNENDNFIIYSMGNFLSNQSLESMGNSFTEDGLMVKLNIEKNFTKDEIQIKEVEYIPTWVYKYKSDGKFHYEIIPVEEVIKGQLELELTEGRYNRIEKSFKDTIDTINGK